MSTDTQAWAEWAQDGLQRLQKRRSDLEEPRWVDITTYGLRRSTKLLDAELFEKVANAGLPKGETKLLPEQEVWATQGKANATKVDSIPLNVPGKPIVLLRLKGRLWVVDGHHRVARARKEGVELPAVVYDADLQVAKSAWGRIVKRDIKTIVDQDAVNEDNLVERDGIHHRTGGRWHHESPGRGLLNRVKKHLQGKHDQKTHGRRGPAKVTTFDPPAFATEAVERWFAEKGGERPSLDWGKVRQDHKKQMRIADAYDSLPEWDNDATGSFEAMARETAEQFRFLTKDVGLKFEATDDDPYRNVGELVADVTNNRRLKVLSTKATGGHPYFDDETNDQFRFVHDFFGHVATGRDFDRHGEEAAYLSHVSMFSDKAKPAMSAETRGQNASLIKNREFGPQKVALLPEEFSKHLEGEHQQKDHGNRDSSRARIVELGRTLSDSDIDLATEAWSGSLPGGLESVVKSILGRNDSIKYRGQLLYSDGQEAGEWVRVVRGDTVEHEYFGMENKYQKQGTARRFFERARDTYSRRGIRSIQLNAQDTGSYAWARLGFDFSRSEDGSPVNASDEHHPLRKLKDKGIEVPKLITPREISELGRDESDGDTWLGKEVLLGSAWHGEMKL